VPPFNFEGAYLKLEAKSVEVDALHRQWQIDAEAAKGSKKAWDGAAETLQKMGLEFRRRRREKAENVTTSDSDATPDMCRFEQLHPGVPCPICTNDARRAASTVAPGSQEHGVEAIQLLERQELEDCVAQLRDVEFYTTVDAMLGMKVDQMAEVQAWAQECSEALAEDRADMLEDLPKALANTHKAGPTEPETSSTEAQMAQYCQVCGDRLYLLEDANDAGIPVGWRVLLAEPCAGKAKRDGHRYPKGKKKTARKAPGEVADEVSEQ